MKRASYIAPRGRTVMPQQHGQAWLRRRAIARAAALGLGGIAGAFVTWLFIIGMILLFAAVTDR